MAEVLDDEVELGVVDADVDSSVFDEPDDVALATGVNELALVEVEAVELLLVVELVNVDEVEVLELVVFELVELFEEADVDVEFVPEPELALELELEFELELEPKRELVMEPMDSGMAVPPALAGHPQQAISARNRRDQVFMMTRLYRSGRKPRIPLRRVTSIETLFHEIRGVKKIAQNCAYTMHDGRF